MSSDSRRMDEQSRNEYQSTINTLILSMSRCFNPSSQLLCNMPSYRVDSSRQPSL